MLCKQCGANNSDSASTCFYCGAQLNENVHIDPTPINDVQDSGNGKTLALVSMILSIVGVVTSVWPCGIVGLILANKANANGYYGGMATVGKILGVVAIVLGIISILFACLGGFTYFAIIMGAMSGGGY